jgi:hypothetical protein
MGLFDYLRDLIGMSFSNTLKNIEDEAMYRINAVTQKVVHRIVREMISVLLILLAVTFLALASVFLFIEYLALTKTISFLIVGAVILFFALILKMIKGR